MTSRMLPAVMIVLLCSTGAQAGIMLGDLAGAGPPAAVRMASSMTPADSSPSVTEHLNLPGPESGMTGYSPPTLNGVGFLAAAGIDTPHLSPPGLNTRISLQNSELPAAPFLDGILRPA